MTASSRSLRLKLLVGASLATLSFAGTAEAQNFGARRTVDPAVAAAQASQTAAQRNAQAEAAAARTRASFEAARQARAQMDAAQIAARQAAMLAETNIPNGLGAGGLQPSANITIDPTLWVGANSPTQSQGENGRTNVTIDQTQEKAILTWETFNVGRETDLTFNHQGNSSWMTLNRVNDPGANPTQILGNIRADGSIYIINPNGVIFGGASQVNVRSIIASSLDIHGGAIEYTRPAGVSDAEWDRLKIAARNERFNAGILAANTGGNQSAPLTFFDGLNVASQTTLADEVFDPYDGVTVEAGAQINVRDGQQAVLLGHNVTNHGTITADDGQVLLVAGRSVLLTDGNLRRPISFSAGEKADGPAIRGFIAGVDRGGLVQNDGLIDVGTGNVSMLGKNVTQAGALFATTNGEIAGSILLQALDGMTRHSNDHTRRLSGFTIGGGTTPAMNSGRGLVLLSGGSYAAILPDAEALAVVGNSFSPSWMQIEAGQIRLMDDAALYLPSGNVELRALAPQSGPNTSRIYIDHGATIDLSGLGGVEVDMEQNSIRAELRANELADNPLLRDSVLRGETVYFDARLGEKLTDGSGVGNLAGWYDLVERDVSQFMTTGGSLSLSGNEVITREGSVIDLSGGSLAYNAGNVQRTRLIDEFGRLVPIEYAQAGVNYVGVEGDFVVSHARWGVTERFTNPFARIGGGSWQAGYVEGRSAGSLLLNEVRLINNISNDAIRILDGEVRANIVIGEYQTDAPTGAGVTDMTRAWRERPSLATLAIGQLFSGANNTGYQPLGGNVVIADRGAILGDGFTADTALIEYGANNVRNAVDPDIQPYQHVLNADWFDGSVFGNVNIVGGYIDVGTQTVQVDGVWVTQPTPFGHGGALTIGEGVTMNLGDYGSLTFTGYQANIDGRIVAPGGAVDLVGVYASNVNTLTPWASLTSSQRPGINLGATGAIDVAGRWINQFANPEAIGAIDGGSVTLAGFNINLAGGSLVDVSGGAMMRTDGSLVLGDGGAIVIDGSVPYLSGAGTAVGSSTQGENQFVLDGALVGYAPGRGGSLTIDTPSEIVISQDLGELASIADGILEAGTAAPKDLVLAAALVVPAGDPLPVDASYSSSHIPPDVAFGATSNLDYYNEANPIALQGDWVVPVGVQVFSTDWIGYWTGGQTVPAGTGIIYLYGSVQAGTSLPSSAFPNGFTNNSAVTLKAPKGAVLATDLTISAGTVLPRDTVLEQAVAVLAPLLITPEHFTQGGFADFAVSGARGLAVKSDTTIEPSVDIVRLDASTLRSTASGVRLFDLLDAGNTGVTLQNSDDLPEGLRPAMSLTLGTAPVNPISGTRPNRIRAGQIGSTPAVAALITAQRYPGTVELETGSEINMYAGSNVTIDALTRIFIDGTISTPGGQITVNAFSNLVSVPATQVRLGSSARLLAAGYERTSFVDGFTVRSVEAGGSIRIQRANQLLIDQNAVLDVSGIAGVTDLLPGGSEVLNERVGSPYVPVAVDGAGGSIEISAASGVLAGNWRAGAGGDTGYGGSVTIYSSSPGIVLSQSADPSADPITGVSQPPSPALLAYADTINASGADHLLLGADDRFTSSLSGLQSRRGLVFDGSVSLTTRRSITINESRISRTSGEDALDGDIEIRSSHVQLRGAEGTSAETINATVPTFASENVGTLSIRADLIDISGLVKLGLTSAEANNANRNYGRGFATTELIATGDIRLLPYSLNQVSTNPTLATTGLRVGGDLVFDSAQVIAATDGRPIFTGATTSDLIEAPEAEAGFLVQARDSITIRSNGNAALTPYSYAQRLTFAAPVIEQGGVVRAPYVSSPHRVVRAYS